jgi:hypothetical protein
MVLRLYNGGANGQDETFRLQCMKVHPEVY